MKKILGFFFFIIALCSLIIGISCFSMYVGSPHNFHEYGGDAYTGIQHAAAQTANNIVLLNKIVTKVSGSFFILVSLVLSSIGFYFFFAPNVNTSPLSSSGQSQPQSQNQTEMSKQESQNQKASVNPSDFDVSSTPSEDFRNLIVKAYNMKSAGNTAFMLRSMQSTLKEQTEKEYISSILKHSDDEIKGIINDLYIKLFRG